MGLLDGGHSTSERVARRVVGLEHGRVRPGVVANRGPCQWHDRHDVPLAVQLVVRVWVAEWHGQQVGLCPGRAVARPGNIESGWGTCEQGGQADGTGPQYEAVWMQGLWQRHGGQSWDVAWVGGHPRVGMGGG